MGLFADFVEEKVSSFFSRVHVVYQQNVRLTAEPTHRVNMAKVGLKLQNMDCSSGKNRRSKEYTAFLKDSLERLSSWPPEKKETQGNPFLLPWKCGLTALFIT